MSTQPRRQSKRRTSAQYLPDRHLRLDCRPCGKISYADKAHAKDERRRLRALSRADGDDRPLDIYRCPEGSGQWHIGHNHLRADEADAYYDELGVS